MFYFARKGSKVHLYLCIFGEYEAIQKKKQLHIKLYIVYGSTLSKSVAFTLTGILGLEILSRQKPKTASATPSASTSTPETNAASALEIHLKPYQTASLRRAPN